MLLIGQQLGPFLIEKELGSGAMGTVYCGAYTKTGMKVAVKVMSPGTLTNKQATLRFKREAEILKQFDHPNIVKIYAIGKHAGLRYYAMEYIKGESLDHVLARRGRLSWEEVVDLGQQLCSALQHSHKKGVIHRDLKPSNLMMLPDGTLKLTDFGIAKDLDVTQLTSANCTVGTASYMSPEQCRGEKELSHKSDLYSLGIVLYELLTGKKPFEAENVMDMFMAHVSGPFVRPSQLAPEIPAWLDTLVCQLMEKAPEQRPLDAEKVGERLAEIIENFEAQKSAGLAAAETRYADRDRVKGRPDEADKDAAQSLLGGKKKKKRKKKKKQPFYQSGWFQIVGAIAILGTMGFIIWWVFLKPPSAERLYTRAETMMKQEDLEQWRRARGNRGVFSEYFEHYGGENSDDTKRQKQMRAWADQIDIRLREQQLEKMVRQTRKGFNVGKKPGAETEAFEASQEEDKGRLSEARDHWEKILADFDKHGIGRDWALLARKRIAMINNVDVTEKALQAQLVQTHRLRKELSIPQESRKQALKAVRYELFGDLFEAMHTWEKLKTDLATKPKEHLWYLLAASKERSLKARLPKLPPKTSEKDFQRELVKKQFTAAEAIQSQKTLQAMGLCMDIIALYGKETALSETVNKAKELFKKLNEV